ncbi:phosphoesterase [Cupriavidus sp. SK-3]|uniref:undecaprenyl-diphosphatase n=1 Tax=Cupriavidus sp. SK-3 TaxID=1470558 RepID=UPI000451799B|nr:undecaprenyl-diphosphatase [Cupriavidus sp. SK-3]KDP87399.1 phosphoesterase [Cupriavidus sp. SK-3]
METLNHSLFLLINAPDHPGAPAVAAATFFAEYAIWIIPALVAIGWLRCGESHRKALLAATVSGCLGLLANQLIGLCWQHPRPFMTGLGHTLIPHAPDSSFPSDHLTLIWAVAFSLMMTARARMAGLALALLGIPVAWARIYLGVHFPLDMAGSAVVALLCGWLALRTGGWLAMPVYRVAIGIYRRLFAKLIHRGWVLP